MATPKKMIVPISRTMTADSYVTAIKNLRNELAETKTRNRLVLTRLVPDETTDIVAFRRNAKWFDIVLELDNNTSIYLRVRRDNLYLYGFRVNAAGSWFELRRTGPNTWCIDENSVALGFGHNYNAILGATGYRSMEMIRLGRDELVTAAEKLAGPATTTEQLQIRARALITVIFMFCEASRLEAVARYMRRTFVGGSTIKNWMMEQVRNWGDLSYAVLNYDQHPTSKWVPQRIVTEREKAPYDEITVELRTVDEVLQYVALLQRDPRTIPPAIRANL